MIEAVRNRKTGKLFIVVDDTLEARYKVVNPAGEVLILSDLLFDEDPVQVEPSAYGEQFTAEQLQAFEEYRKQEDARAISQARQERDARSRAPTVVRADPAPRKRTSRAVPVAQSAPGRIVEWDAPRLTFYRHKIDPMAPRQRFRVHVDGKGTFEMTKEDFLSQFNDVVMSPGWRRDGLYAYPEVPPKAERFRKG